MRKWHRWISLFFGIFMLWIAGTGVLSHVASWWPLTAAEAAAGMPPAPVDWECPKGWMCRPLPQTDGIKSLTGFIHHLHGGSEFGPAGEVISFLSGLALLFFSVSGIWLYTQMWRNRRQRKSRGGLFWD